MLQEKNYIKKPISYAGKKKEDYINYNNKPEELNQSTDNNQETIESMMKNAKKIIPFKVVITHVAMSTLFQKSAEETCGNNGVFIFLLCYGVLINLICFSREAYKVYTKTGSFKQSIWFGFWSVAAFFGVTVFMGGFPYTCYMNYNHQIAKSASILIFCVYAMLSSNKKDTDELVLPLFKPKKIGYKQ